MYGSVYANFGFTKNSSMDNGSQGLLFHERALNVESNNVANVNTIGFKADLMSFDTILYDDSTTKDYKKQGNIKYTGQSYDMAIKGDGFFITKDSYDQTLYTRAGQFRMGNDGTLQTSEGNFIMGVPTTTPAVVSSGDTVFDDKYINFIGSTVAQDTTSLYTINARATDYKSSATDSGISGSGYKKAGSKVRDIDMLATEYRKMLTAYRTNTEAGTVGTAQSSVMTFDTSMINQDSDYVSIKIDGTVYNQLFDTDGQTTLNKLSDQISQISGMVSSVTSSGELTITSMIPGKIFNVNTPRINDNSPISINTTNSTQGSGLAAINSVRDILKTAIENAGAKFIELTNLVNTNISDDAVTLNKLQLKLDTLKITDTANSFGSPIIEDGIIYMKNSGNKFVVGKVSTAIFTHPSGLEPQGYNMLKSNDISGKAIMAPNEINKIVSKSLEVSTSNLADSLVKMMVFQKGFEGSSKSITTSDDFLKTAIALKK